MKTFILAHEAARDSAKQEIDATPLDGKMKVEIKKVGSKRSVAQNNLYQVWSRAMANELGYSHDQMKVVFVQAYLSPVIVQDLKGNNIEVWPSTTKLNVKPFLEFLNMIDIEAAGLGIRLDKTSDDYYVAMAMRAE